MESYWEGEGLGHRQGGSGDERREGACMDSVLCVMTLNDATSGVYVDARQVRAKGSGSKVTVQLCSIV